MSENTNVPAPVQTAAITTVTGEIVDNVDTGTLFLGKAKNGAELEDAMKAGGSIQIAFGTKTWSPAYKGSMGQGAKLHVFFQRGGLAGGLPPVGVLVVTVTKK